MWQSYPWTQVTGGQGNVGAQLAGLGGIDFNALLQMLKPKEPQTTHTPWATANDRYLQDMQKTAELKKIQAQIGPPPMKMTYVGNSPGFLELDPLAMNAFQRQAFLPQGANFYGTDLQTQDLQNRAQDMSGFYGFNQWSHGANPFTNMPNPNQQPQPEEKKGKE